jgi:glycosyltransferase involved in cell wall biosynthesis
MVLNYYSFPISGWFWNRFNKVKADMVFSFETSPMTQVKVGCGYAKKHKVPHFAYIQDLWPENVETVTGIHSKLVIGPINRMVDKIYKKVDRIFVTSPSFVDAVVNRKKPVDPKKVKYWPQYAEEFYQPMERQKINGISDDDSFKIAFTGNIGTAQGLGILPNAAKLLKEENVRFVIVGDGRYQKEFEKHIDACGVRDMFTMIPRVPANRIPEILSACDAGFISFNKTPLWERTIPAKLQSYMACGKPIIASASGETKRVIDEARCGICCEIGNADELADGVRKMMKADLTDMGINARSYFLRHFEKKELMDEMDLEISQV